MKKILFITLSNKQFNFIDWKGVISDAAAKSIMEFLLFFQSTSLHLSNLCKQDVALR